MPFLAGATERRGKERRVPVLALPSLPTSSMPTQFSQPAGNGARFALPCAVLGDGEQGGARNSPQVMSPSLELKLYGVLRGLQLPSLSLL